MGERENMRANERFLLGVRRALALIREREKRRMRGGQKNAIDKECESDRKNRRERERGRERERRRTSERKRKREREKKRDMK